MRVCLTLTRRAIKTGPAGLNDLFYLLTAIHTRLASLTINSQILDKIPNFAARLNVIT